MANLILNFPITKLEKRDPSQVLYLKLAHQAYIIDLTEQRRKIAAMQREVDKIKRRLIMRVVEGNADDKGST